MSHDQADARTKALNELQSAAEAFSKPEVQRISEAVIAELRSRSPVGIFEDVGARHMWDEYCWALQEGPFGDNFGFGSVSGNYDDTVRTLVQSELEKLPRHALVFLSAHVCAESSYDQDEFDGSVSMDSIESAVMEEINRRAGERSLDLIGPHRADALGYEVECNGVVWSALSDRVDVSDLLPSHVDALVDPTADLSEVAHEIVEAFICAAKDNDEGLMLSDLLDGRLGDEIKKILLKNDVLPAVQDMRDSLLERLDP